MKNASLPLQQEVIQQYCRQLRVPSMAAQFRRLAETAASQQQTHLDYLEALLGAEMEERKQNTIQRRLKEAHLPEVKTLGEFQFSAAPHIAASKLKELADGGYIERAEPCSSSAIAVQEDASARRTGAAVRSAVWGFRIWPRTYH